MASRRKGRPVRRLETTPGLESLKINKEVEAVATRLKKETDQTKDELHNFVDETAEVEKNSVADIPPEGVFVVHPQSASDELDPEINKLSAKKQEQSAKVDASHLKKRLQNGSPQHLSRSKKESEGIDSNVKRRRIYNGSANVLSSKPGKRLSQILAVMKNTNTQQNVRSNEDSMESPLRFSHSAPRSTPKKTSVTSNNNEKVEILSMKKLFENAATDRPYSPCGTSEQPSRSSSAVENDQNALISKLTFDKSFETVSGLNPVKEQSDKNESHPDNVSSATSKVKKYNTNHLRNANLTEGCDFASENEPKIDDHLRNEAYAKLGLKKVHSNEECTFHPCPWNRVATHFHCLRYSFSFSFTTSNRLVAYKSNHDKPYPNDTNVSISELTQGPAKKVDLVDEEVSIEVLLMLQLGNSMNQWDHMALQTVMYRIYREFETSDGLLSVSLSKEKSSGKVTSQHNDVISSSSEIANDKTNGESPRNRYHVDKNNSDGTKLAEDSLLLNRTDDVTAASADSEEAKFQNTTMLLPSTTLKYFKRFTCKCPLTNCVFTSLNHYHCVIEGCCAVFTEQDFILSHSLFHENLEKRGVEQNRAKLFSSDLSWNGSRTASATPTPSSSGFVPLSSLTKFGLRNYVPRNKLTISKTSKPISSPFRLQKDQKRSFAAIRPKVDTKKEFTSLVLKQRPSSTWLTDKNNKSNSALVGMDSKSNSFGEDKKSVLVKIGKSLTSAGMDQKTEQVSDNSAMLSSMLHSYSTSPPRTPKNESKPSAPSDLQNSSADYIHIQKGEMCLSDDCKYLGQAHWHCTLSRCRYVCKSLAKAQSHLQTHDSLESYARAAKDFFECYTVKRPCPHSECEFRLRGHYHCTRPGCHFVTFGTSKLPWHVKKHEKIARREASGFKYYTKKDLCLVPDCKYSGCFTHYHCVRPGCAYAFQYKHQLSTHVRKHLRREMGKTFTDLTADQPTGGVPLSLAVKESKTLQKPIESADGENLSPNMQSHYQIVDFNDVVMETDNASEDNALLPSSDRDGDPDCSYNQECNNGSSSEQVLDLSNSNADSDSNSAVS